MDRQLDAARVARRRGAWSDAESRLAGLLATLRRRGDFLRLGIAVQELLDVRRARWSLAAEARRITIVDCLENVDDLRDPGCYLVQPPMIGAEGRRFLEAAIARNVAVRVVTREPMTRSGRWPVVAVGTGSADTTIVRTQVDPPPHVEPMDTGMTRDLVHAPPPAAWFETAAEALSHAAIAKIDTDQPAAWRVDDLLDVVCAHPEGAAAHEALRAACLEADEQGEPEHERPAPEDEVLWF